MWPWNRWRNPIPGESSPGRVLSTGEGDVGGWTCITLVLQLHAVGARRLDRLSITAPIVLVVAGTVLGAGYLDVLPANLSAESVRSSPSSRWP